MQGKGDIAARVSETVNTINSLLSNPVSRTAYILEQEGVTNDPESILDDPTVVMEVMEAREALEEAQSEEEVEEIRAENHGASRHVSCLRHTLIVRCNRKTQGSRK